MMKFKKNLWQDFRENYEWGFKVSKYNKSKTVLNVIVNYVRKSWLHVNGILVLNESYNI